MRTARFGGLVSMTRIAQCTEKSKSERPVMYLLFCGREEDKAQSPGFGGDRVPRDRGTGVTLRQLVACVCGQSIPHCPSFGR